MNWTNGKFGKASAIVLSLALIVVTLLTGCNSGKKDTQPSPSNPASSSPADSATPTAAAPPPKINILISHALTKYAMQATNDDRYIKELSKLSGFDLSYDILGHDDEFDQQLSVRFASGDLPDLIRTNSILSPNHKGALENGAFLELGPLIDKYGPNIKKNIPEEVWKSPKLSKDGKIYGIPALRPFPGTDILYIRQDWLDKLGMKQPVTIDDYLAYFEAVKVNDMNGNGDPNDEYGLYVRQNMSYADLFFPQFAGNVNFWQYRDGELVPNMIVPEMKEAIKFWKMLYDKGYINPNLFTNASKDWIAGILQGKAGMWQHELLNFQSTWSLDAFVDQPDAKLSFIKSPEGPNGHGLWAENDQVYFAWVIPAKTKNPEEVIKFLDWAWSEEADNFFNYGIEGYNYTIEDGKVKWDLKSPANAENEANVFYQLILNPRGDGRMKPKLLDYLPDSEMLKTGIEVATYEVTKRGDLHMPDLKALEAHPELNPDMEPESLFLEMFAKILVKNAPLDETFDKFVADWKKRGGDAAIKEATEWYRAFHKL